MITPQDLRRVDLFDDLDEAALEAFAAVAQERTFEPDACVGDQGDNPEGVMLLLEGTLPDRRRRAGAPALAMIAALAIVAVLIVLL